MNDDKKQQSSRRLLLVGVVGGIVLGSVITVGAFWISPSDFKNAKNSVINIVKNLNWEWTGFVEGTTKEETIKKTDKLTETIKYESGKTLWDWLDLGAVPILIFIFGLWFQQREKKRAEKQDELQEKIAKDNLSEEAIQAYLDNIGKLLIHKGFRKELFPNETSNLSDQDNPVRDVARTQTTTILRRLEDDKNRQAIIIYFLRDAELYNFILRYANLSGVNLKEANLWNANLSGAHLSGTNLSGTNLQGAKLSGAENLPNEQIKSACNWEQANFAKYWDKEKKEWVEDEGIQKAKLTELKEDTASNPQYPPNCDRWK